VDDATHRDIALAIEQIELIAKLLQSTRITMPMATAMLEEVVNMLRVALARP
jgi:hypothetical protein